MSELLKADAAEGSGEARKAPAADEFWGAFRPAPGVFRNGRSVADGYARGWGLQFNNLREKILQDPLYAQAAQLANGRSVMSEWNRLNLYLIIKYFLAGYASGHIIEFGTYRGGNALFMAHVAKALYPGMKVFALDTFRGMPKTDASVDAHGEGDFGNVDLGELRSFAAAHGLDNIEFVEGLFEDTAPRVLGARADRIALAHIDCDIYSAVKYSYEAVKPFMLPKGYIVFDDATVPSCIGATEAVEDFVIRRDGLNSEQIFPQFVFRAP